MARTRGSWRVCWAANDPSLPPTRQLPVPAEGEPLDWGAYFDAARPVEVDVGCGKGRFLLARARASPDVQLLGIERERARVARLDRVARREGLRNVRVLRADAMQALTTLLPDVAVAVVYFFFPDPWPKRRHWKRRLFTPLFVESMHRILRPNGMLHVATDQADYCAAMRQSLDTDPRFAPVPTIERSPAEYTDFELIFRRQGLPIHAASYRKRACNAAMAAPETAR